MRIKVIGIEEAKFTFEGGNSVSGQYIHFTEAMGKNGIGLKAGKFFLSDARLKNKPDFEIGKEFDVYFDRYKKPEMWQVC